MPAQKRSLPENLEDEESRLHHQNHTKQSRTEDEQHKAEDVITQPEEEQEAEQEQEEQEHQKQDPDDQNHQVQLQGDDEDEDEDDSDGSQSSTSQEKLEFVFVELPEIRKDVQCPICLDSSINCPNISETIRSTLFKQRSLGKESTGVFMTRSQRNHRSTHPRSRRNSRGAEHQGSEDNEDENDDNGGKDSSSTNEHCTEVRQRRRKRHAGIRASQPSSSVVNSDGGCVENDTEVSRDSRGISPGLVWNPDMLAWGRGGARSHTRHGNSCGGSSKSSRARLNRLVEYFRSLEENDDELDVHLKLISVDEQSTSSLQQPYLCCRPSLSVKQLCEYIALQTPLRAEEVEILMVKGQYYTDDNHSNPTPLTSEDALQLLEGQETLAGLKVKCSSGLNHLILAYRQKQTN
ncbi:hypothetical protein CRYUN_Cryun10bG0065200 [Craigia yunnanensis]